MEQELYGQIQTLVTAVKELIEQGRRQPQTGGGDPSMWDTIIPVPFLSWTDASNPSSAGYISDVLSSALITEMEKHAQVFNADFTGLQLPNESGAAGGLYNTSLMPMADMTDIFRAKEVMIKSCYFALIDTTVFGGASQDVTTWNTLIASLSTDRPLVQAQMENTVLPMFMPNGFRPVIRVNGIPKFGGNLLNSFAKGTNNAVQRVHQLVGIPNPYDNPNMNLYCGEVDAGRGIQVSAWGGQVIGSNILRYTVYGYLEFYTRGRK
ncbi:MAG: hypothetical protein JNL32_04740 [Candidatus Kapabacteria bacterium]|nr:hypothetical protein [Candidatus Kapabacteria bacterium]